MISLTRLQLIAIQCLLLLTLARPTRADSLPAPVPVCKESEFLCREESRCIASNKVCNFVDDCVDGSDELQCGSCRFEEEPKSCGLRFRGDRVYSWYRRAVSEVYLGFASDDEQPTHYMGLDLDIPKQKYLSLSASNWHVIYRPMVLFPELRPTDNKNCRLSIRMLLTDHVSPFVEKSTDRISWPQMSVLIAGAKKLDTSNSTNHRTINLSIPQTFANHHGSWLTFMVPIGAQETVWTVEMLISVYLQSYLLHLSNFQFLDCRPSDEWLAAGSSSSSATEAPLRWHQACNVHEFKCEVTGKCIDEALVCDYGYDCGTDDPSDESDCQHFQARCDFETGNHLCGWMPVSRGDVWKLVSAEEEDQMMYRFQRPMVDHTFRSKQAGHYLIVNSKELRVSQKYSLAGPRVTLKEGAKECNFRLWYQVASTLSFDLVKSPYLLVGFEHISAQKLFETVNVTTDETEQTIEGGLELYNMGWRRLQVHLLDRYNIDERVLSVLEIAFGNFDDDLQYYLDSGGYLALDDFSFSLGCSVAFYGDRQEQFCADSQFFCLSKTPVTGARCIPMNNYCDFKNDCGLLKSSDELASDELECPAECHFRDNQHCGFKPMDAAAKRISNELAEGRAANEAFTWSLATNETNVTSKRALVISSNSANFIEQYMSSLKSGTGSLVELETFELRLPVFSVSHSNCTFSMDYEWTDGGNNVRAELRLLTDHNGHRNLMKTLWNKRAHERESVSVGLGNQMEEFVVVVAVSHRYEVEYLKPIKESFIIHHYKFSSCSFVAGLIAADDEVKFINEEDSLSIESMDYPGAAVVDSSVNKECEAGYFQCEVPIVCIARELVCDMQQDCQGGADERHCSQFHQYDLYQKVKNNSLPDGWLVDGGEDLRLRPYSWRLVSGVTMARRLEDSGPPFDHSRSDYLGDYLIAGGETKPSTEQVTSDLYSPLFRLLDPSRPAASGDQCRVVFYLYAWGKDVGTLRVLKRTYPSGKAHVIHESRGPLEDRWLRNWLVLDPRMRADPADEEFSLVFQFMSGVGTADAIALDDISFSPGCVRATGDGSARLSSKLVVVAPESGTGSTVVRDDAGSSGAPTGDAVAERGGDTRALGGPLRAALLLLAATCGIVLVAYVSFLGFGKVSSVLERRKIRQRRLAGSARASQSFVGAEYSLDNLDRVQLWLPSDTLSSQS